MTPEEPYDDLVLKARHISGLIRWCGVLSFGTGWVVIIAAIVGLVADMITVTNFEELLIVLGAGGVVSGVALFGTSWSLRLAAARLEIDIAAKLPARVPPVAGDLGPAS